MTPRGLRRHPFDADDARETVTLTEMAIKPSLGKLRRFGHCRGTTATPFDQMLVAQAQTQALTLATMNQRMVDYGIPLLR